MKKLLSILMCVILLVGMSACSKSVDTSAVDEEESVASGQTETKDTTSNESAETSDAEPAKLGGKVVVGRWGGNDSETAAFAAMLEAFTAATGVEVEERVYSDYNQELQTELIGQTAPDVFYVDAYMAPFYISQGVLKPLDATTYELDAFYGPLREAFAQDGQYYAVSKDYSTLGLYYNKKYVDPTTIPTTLEELLGGDYLTELAKTLPEGMVAMTYNQDLARNMFVAQAGGVDITKDGIYSNIASDKVVNNLSVYYDAAVAGKIKTPADLGQGWNGDAFGNEVTAIMIEGNWTLGHLANNFPDVDFGTMEIPTFKGEKGSMVFTVGYGINAAAKNPDQAEAFIQFATGQEGMSIWTTGAGVLPSREDVALLTDVASDELKVPHIAAAAYATAWQKGTTMDTINTEYRNYIPSVVSGERTLKEALQMAQDEANSTIEANQ